MTHIKGIATSTGIAIAHAYKLTLPDLSFPKIQTTDPQVEIDKLISGLDAAICEIKNIRAHMKNKLDEEHASIFSAQILLLRDPTLIESVKKKIKNKRIKAEVAFQEATDDFITLLKSMDNKYMQERAIDLYDVTKRVLSHLIGVQFPDVASLNKEVIIVANELTPSLTALLNKQYVKGFSTEVGGPTSHSSIIAKSLDIPAIVGAKGITKKVSHGDLIIIDSMKEIIIKNPSNRELHTYREKSMQYKNKKKKIQKNNKKIVITKDNKQIALGGNINHPREAQHALANGANKIGLFRTEFLYMDKQLLPTENEQYKAYKSVLKKMDNRPVIIRTVDIGGDKQLTSVQIEKENNPFLGSRGIRFCLENEILFRTQLRALLRASIHGTLKLTFPMVSTVDEFTRAKAITLDVKSDLQRAGENVSDNIEIGMMIEVPSAALIAKQFAKIADFFSIGTNDLIQYTIAVDRMNENVSHLYRPYHPAILQLIDTVVQAAQSEGIKVSVCGEMANDPLGLPVLLSLGVDSFSMNGTSIREARSRLMGLSKCELSTFRQDILSLGTQKEVIDYMKKKLN